MLETSRGTLRKTSFQTPEEAEYNGAGDDVQERNTTATGQLRSSGIEQWWAGRELGRRYNVIGTSSHTAARRWYERGTARHKAPNTKSYALAQWRLSDLMWSPFVVSEPAALHVLYNIPTQR